MAVYGDCQLHQVQVISKPHPANLAAHALCATQVFQKIQKRLSHGLSKNSPQQLEQRLASQYEQYLHTVNTTAGVFRDTIAAQVYDPLAPRSVITPSCLSSCASGLASTARACTCVVLQSPWSKFVAVPVPACTNQRVAACMLLRVKLCE